MADSGIVGLPQSSSQAGTTQAVALANLNEIIVAEDHGRLYVPAYNKALFSGGTQATVVATALQTGLTTAATGGLILYNPLSNNKNLVLEQFGLAFIVAQNAGAVGIGVGFSSSVAPSGTLTVVPSQCAYVNGPTATGVLYSSATVTLPVAPYAAKWLLNTLTGAITVAPNGGPSFFDLAGSIILPPGGYACVVGSAVGVASSLFANFTWTETPV